MTEIPATYFDGRTSQPRDVVLRWHAFDGMLEVIGGDSVRRFPRREVTIESRLGHTPRFIRFADGGRCEVADSAELDAVIASWAPNHGGRWLHRLEASWALVLLATVVLGGFCWVTIQFALPAAARRVAFALPADLTRQLGEQTLTAMDKSMLEPTKLTHERQLELRKKFAEFLAGAKDATPYQIEFRAAPGMGANAFALPSGAIVITDELVQLAKDDRELIGVLAHECGHIQHRHTLRSVLQNSAVFVVVALVTGDVSSATAFGSALPTFLLQSQFSRSFEREADAYAIEKMRAGGIDPGFLADALQRLADSHGGEPDSRLLGYLRTHPPTPERIETVRGKR